LTLLLEWTPSIKATGIGKYSNFEEVALQSGKLWIAVLKMAVCIIVPGINSIK
jgi:hypothetical protein